MTIKQLIHIFRSHNIVTFTLTGMGETIMNTEQFEPALEQIEKLEQLINLGRMTEAAYSQGYCLIKLPDKERAEYISEAVKNNY